MPGRITQDALMAVDVVVAARWAWWCACLSVLALAVAAVVGYVSDPQVSHPVWASRGLAAAVATAVMVVSVVGTVATTRGSPPLSLTASRVDAPTLAVVDGSVGYTLSERGAEPRPAGAGFVREIRAETGGNQSRFSVEGFDGATGKRRWVFGPLDGLSVLGSTGVGPDSVVVAWLYNILIGLDATTGEALWFKRGETALNSEETGRGVAPQVLITVRARPTDRESVAAGGGEVWEALAPRTGEVVWSKEFGYRCFPRFYPAVEFVVTRTCEQESGTAADILHASTGEVAGHVTLAALGVDAAAVDAGLARVSVEDVRGDRALVKVERYGPGASSRTAVVSLRSGAVSDWAPDGVTASFIDESSVALSRYGGRDVLATRSIWDLNTQQIFPVGFARNWAGAEDGFGLITRAGGSWWTLTPPDRAADTAAFNVRLRSVDGSGVARDWGNPCEGAVSVVPGILAVPGALLVDCPQNTVGVR